MVDMDTPDVVYKVCRITDEGKLHSAVAPASLRLAYDIGVKTYGIPGTPVMAFYDPDDARDFGLKTIQRRGWAILQCEASVKYFGEAILPLMYFELAPANINPIMACQSFWSNNNNFAHSRVFPPAGTVFCEWILPLIIYDTWR